MKNLIKAVKTGTRETLETMIRLAINMIKATMMGLTAFFKNILDAIKPLERLRSAIKAAEKMIRMVVEKIADILKQMAAMVDVKSTILAIQKKLKRGMEYIGETEKNLVKFGKALA